jgi:hypothetical protein
LESLDVHDVHLLLLHESLGQVLRLTLLVRCNILLKSLLHIECVAIVFLQL